MKRLFASLLLAITLLGAADRPLDFSAEQQRLEKLAHVYQHKFKADAFTVGVRLVTVAELDNLTGSDKACGASFAGFKPGRYLIIWVLRSDQYKIRSCNSSNVKIDQENTVVHEYVHFLVNFAGSDEMIAQIAADVIKHSPQQVKK